MREVAEQLRSDSAFTRKILEPVEIAGVERWDASAVVLRCRFKVAPLEQWGVRREYLRRLKAAFDELGIEIPYPHLTVYAGAPKSGQAPPFQLQGLRLDGRHPDAPSSPVVPPAPEEAATRRLR
jgi:small conductance mechanosensitive channel